MRIIKILHQLPQYLFGLWITRNLKPCHSIGEVKIYKTKKIEGLSLGFFILIDPDIEEGLWILKHEFGHIIQSRILGWLYILIIVIPSYLWYKYGNSNVETYYDFYTEKWANKLIMLHKRVGIENRIYMGGLK